MTASRLAAQFRSLSSDRRVQQGCLAAAAATAVLLASGQALRRRPSEETPEDESLVARSFWTQRHSNVALTAAPHKSLMESFQLPSRLSSFRRHATILKLDKTKNTSEKLESKYKVDWKRPLGQGTFGAVYSATNKATGEAVAVKKISKQFTDNLAFQREMEALLHLRENGGHPYICGLQENYDEGDFYYLVLDLVSGGEMFDHLCQQGAYSEADAARLVREVASALAFMHGIEIVHGDMKPENLMLSTTQSASSVIKVVDFGCAQVDRPGSGLARHDSHKPRGAANTPAYSPPEVLNRFKGKDHIEPSFDMWALGVILYIMLTGVHPFDLYGNSSDEEIEEQILSGKQPPLGKSPLTAHLSDDAIHLIKKLLIWDPRKRLTAQQLLNHPWVRGETARTSKIADSDKRLSAYRAFKTQLEARVFADMVAMSDNLDGNEVMKKTSLIERSFYMLNPDHRGYVTTKTLRKLTKEQMDGSADAAQPLSLSGFSDILAENMKNRYFPKGHVLYREGDRGDAMYFINSGTVEVYTGDGFTKTLRKAGESFGEGALLHPKKIRSASIRTITPVHAIEISREYFEKYLATEEGAKLNLREKDKQRKRQRAKTILQLQQNLKEVNYKRGDYVWRKGDEGKQLYLIEEGRIGVNVDDLVVLTLRPGELCGEHSLVFGRPRNVDAVCVSEHCKLQAMSAGDFYKLLESHPSLKESIRDICLRRDFQKALCARIKKPFPKKIADLREAFDIVDNSKSGAIELRELRTIIKRFDPNFTEHNIREVLQSLDLDESGKVSWAEFKKMFDLGSSS